MAKTNTPDPATEISSEAAVAEKKEAQPAKKSLTDVLHELGIPIVKKNGGGCVITGVKPQ